MRCGKASELANHLGTEDMIERAHPINFGDAGVGISVGDSSNVVDDTFSATVQTLPSF